MYLRMIIWIASYPKSGNTWIRSLLSTYFFSKDGKFNFELLKNIDQFTSKNIKLNSDKGLDFQSRISKNWIEAQKIINQDKKIHLFKTHNALCAINGNKFTNQLNTVAAIYIVRDPRNLITSLAHHYEFNLNETYNFLTNKRKIIFPKNFVSQNQKDPDDFNFLGDWGNHYHSWKNINFCPIQIIRYEDILTDVNKTFTLLLKFLLKFMQFTIDKKKIDNVIKSTSFEKLSQMESKQGFYESVTSPQSKNKIKFFNLGKKNNWKKLLDVKMIKKIDSKFEKEMKELQYL